MRQSDFDLDGGATVFELWTLFPADDLDSPLAYDWSYDDVFETPEAAMAYVPLFLDGTATGRWRMSRVNGRRRWVSPLPARLRRGIGWSSGWVVQESTVRRLRAG